MSIENNEKKSILFLYSELAQYFLSCVNKLADEYDFDIHIVRWQINAEAPFDFKIDDRITLYNRNDCDFTTLLELTEKIDPDLIFCSGWMDNEYIRVCRLFKNKIPVIVGLDNRWKGTFKQRAAAVFNRWTVKKWFNYAWVAGMPQKRFALKLGFDESTILEGVYSADYEYFNNRFEESIVEKKEKLPHRFVYVGRYIERKGIKELWEAFVQLYEETGTDWELWCCGTGPLENESISHPQIRHLGFVQPEQMKDVVKETSVFVLPSHTEPWGVVVHEFAAAGFPLICSDQVGAATQFLKEEENGYLFEPTDTDGLKQKMGMIINKTDSELISMGKKSSELAAQNTPSIWAEKLAKVAENN